MGNEQSKKMSNSLYPVNSSPNIPTGFEGGQTQQFPLSNTFREEPRQVAFGKAKSAETNDLEEVKAVPLIPLGVQKEWIRSSSPSTSKPQMKVPNSVKIPMGPKQGSKLSASMNQNKATVNQTTSVPAQNQSFQLSPLMQLAKETSAGKQANQYTKVSWQTDSKQLFQDRISTNRVNERQQPIPVPLSANKSANELGSHVDPVTFSFMPNQPNSIVQSVNWDLGKVIDSGVNSNGKFEKWSKVIRNDSEVGENDRFRSSLTKRSPGQSVSNGHSAKDDQNMFYGSISGRPSLEPQNGTLSLKGNTASS